MGPQGVEATPRIGRPRSDRSRQAILREVRRLLLHRGYARLTIEEVARAAAVSKATVYRWWSSKGELVLEAAEQDIAIGTVPDSGDAVADIGVAIDQLIGTFSRPLASVVIFAAITTGASDPKMAAIFRDRFVHPWRRSAAAALQRAATSGLLAQQDTDLLLDVVVGTVFQRTLVVRTPAVAGLREDLLGLILSPSPDPATVRAPAEAGPFG